MLVYRSVPSNSARTWTFFLGMVSLHTPLKFNMEPKNHPIEKENHLNQTIIFRFHVKFRGSNPKWKKRWSSTSESLQILWYSKFVTIFFINDRWRSRFHHPEKGHGFTILKKRSPAELPVCSSFFAAKGDELSVTYFFLSDKILTPSQVFVWFFVGYLYFVARRQGGALFIEGTPWFNQKSSQHMVTWMAGNCFFLLDFQGHYHLWIFLFDSNKSKTILR